MRNKEEKIGEIFLGIEVLLFSLFPVLVHEGVKTIPPFHYLAYVTLMTVPLFIGTTLWRHEWKQLLNRKVWPYILGVVLCVATLPNMIIFWATQHTSGINTTLLMQSEVVFAALVGLSIGENLSRGRWLGIGFIMLGSVAILYNGTLSVNKSDLLIFLGTAFFPIGNLLAKKVLETISWSSLLLARAGVGGIILLVIATLTEKNTHPSAQEWGLIVFVGLGIFGISKILWYIGLQRLDISKATAIGMSYPAFSLLFAFFLFNEIPNAYQWVGILMTSAGLISIVRTTSKQYAVIDKIPADE